jgi:CRP/FNR family transcriptional regulator
LGLSAVVSQLPYEVTAEALESCQANFVKGADFLRFLQDNPQASLHAARQLSRNYHRAYTQVRSLGLSSSAAEKLARLLLNLCLEEGRRTESGVQLRLGLTHGEIAEMIGTSRETVSRLFKEFRENDVLRAKGMQITIPDSKRLESYLSV